MDPLPDGPPAARSASFTGGSGHHVSALVIAPTLPRALYVFGHGAGAGMRHSFMEAAAERLAARGIATFRYQFPYMERGSRRPDRRDVLLGTVRAAVEAAQAEVPGVPLVVGGKSMGGRMTSQAHAEEPLPDVRGFVFFGFPLHRPGQRATERADHLAFVDLPMLFLQGTRDEMANLDLIREVTGSLAPRATLHLVDDADHGFHVRKSSGRTDDQVLDDLADRVDTWVRETLGL